METQTLLGYLARFGSFAMQSELLCTQGLTYLLQRYEDARFAMAKLVNDRTGIDVDSTLRWEAEAAQEDGSRPDLEGYSAEGVPVVKIEAKLLADLLPSQVQCYVKDLRERNNFASAMLVLVPDARITEATNVTASALELLEFGPWQATDGHRTETAIISWNQLFDAFQAGKTELFRYELEQLRAMYRVLSGDYIAPLADIEDLHQWRERETDFVNLIDKITRRLTTRHKLYPMQVEPLDGVAVGSGPSVHRFRYVCPVAKSCFSIGVRDPFAGWVTPVWMRFHKRTGNFQQIRQRIEASAVTYLPSSGHIWIPLEVPLAARGEQMVQVLVDEAGEIVRMAYRTR